MKYIIEWVDLIFLFAPGHYIRELSGQIRIRFAKEILECISDWFFRASIRFNQHHGMNNWNAFASHTSDEIYEIAKDVQKATRPDMHVVVMKDPR